MMAPAGFPIWPHICRRCANTALSVQVHPELGPDFVQSLLDGGLGVDIASDFARQIRSGLGGKLNRGKVAQGFVRVLGRSADPDRPLG